MVEGICYICNQSYSGSDKDTLINQEQVREVPGL